MFIRSKPNKSGVVSIQIIDKNSGKYRVVKTVGSSKDPVKIKLLLETARDELNALTGQTLINFEVDKEKQLVDLFFKGINEIRLKGPELILGKLFDEIGFNKIKDKLFRHLVIARLCYPVSKLKTVDYLLKYKGLAIDVDRIYRYMDKLHSKQRDLVQKISYDHSFRILGNRISTVFYDVTTLYFEIEDQDELRKTGFSKDGKHQHPQILLGLLISEDGYPWLMKYLKATNMKVIQCFLLLMVLKPGTSWKS